MLADKCFAMTAREYDTHEITNIVHTVIYVCWLPMYHAGENLHSLDGIELTRYGGHAVR